MTGKPNAAKRAGSPLALRIRVSHCGARRAMTRSRMVRPAIWRIGLSPPPIRRARPPASKTPGMFDAPLRATSVVTRFALALVARGFLFDIVEVLVEHDALLPGQCNEALSARASYQRQPYLPRQLDAPGGEAGARNENGYAHPHRLDHHFRREPPRRVHDLVAGIDVVAEHPARDLVDSIVAADILGVADGPAFLTQHAAMNRAGLEIK